MKELTEYEKMYTPEQRMLSEHIIGLEKAALDKWFNGDTSGYRKLWSENNFSYFDSVGLHRIDDHKAICNYLDTIEGKLHANSYDFCCPRVQFGQDMALLTFQLYAKTNLLDMKYDCIELYQKEGDEWHVIHSTWSFIRPLDMNFSENNN